MVVLEDAGAVVGGTEAGADVGAEDGGAEVGAVGIEAIVVDGGGAAPATSP